ncbi:MAG TPA: alcohol dehydrogenase catalytic domain-containing protein [Polyangiaceae bacterium]|nr:alcohol dehydrogenase catalytic domain-containing protein [Polyangiaceae bacterium]
MNAQPEYFRPEDAGALYVERADRVIAAGRARAGQGMPPASQDTRRVCVFGIDMQVGFCLPQGSLFVPGAVADTERALGFVYGNLSQITSVVLSQDTHSLGQIFFADFWLDDSGAHPAPFTVISHSDVASGRFRPRFFQEEALEYLDRLQRSGRYQLTIWPYHTLRGGLSQAIVPALLEAALYHGAARDTRPLLVEKGMARLTENYSVLSPEVQQLGGAQLGRFDEALFQTLMEHDRIYVMGQAKSHCVLSTLRDLAARAEQLDPSLLAKVHVLVDAMSPVAPPPLDPLPPSLDFPALAEAGLRELGERGMRLVRCAEGIDLETAGAASPGRASASTARRAPRSSRSAGAAAPSAQVRRAGSMSAVLLEGGQVACATAPKPGLESDDSVVIRVAYAGVCRTDLAVAAGTIPVATPLVLGHEFSGYVEALGPGVQSLRVGDRVSVDPRIACGTCAHCVAGGVCSAPRRLGREQHGCFSEYIAVPASSVLAVPDALSLRVAAYLEPVAAAIAVDMALLDLDAGSRGLVFGDNRFTALALRLLRDRTDFDVTAWAGDQGAPDASAYDFVVETSDPRTPLGWAVQALRPGGRLVLKSRGALLSLPFEGIVEKELRLQGAAYGEFATAMQALEQSQTFFSTLLGREFALADFAACFDHASGDESKKTLLCIGGGD